MKKNRFLMFVIILLFKSIVVLSQNSINENQIVNNFVKTVFFEQSTPKTIADKYILFRAKDNPEASIDDRIKMLGKHLKKIKKDKKSLIDPADYSVVNYNDYNDSKVYFSKNTNAMYILISKGKPVMYFYLENEKIISFDYFLKTNEGYFILY